MTSPLPIWGHNYPLIGVFALVCELIHYLFALESISWLYSVSKQSFLGIFVLSFLSRLDKCEEGVRRLEDNKVFSPFSLLRLASLTMADSPCLASVLLYGPSCSLSSRCYGMTPASWALIIAPILCHSSIRISISLASCCFYFSNCLSFPCLGSLHVHLLTNASVRFSLLERSTVVFFSLLDYK